MRVFDGWRGGVLEIRITSTIQDLHLRELKREPRSILHPPASAYEIIQSCSDVTLLGIKIFWSFNLLVLYLLLLSFIHGDLKSIFNAVPERWGFTISYLTWKLKRNSLNTEAVRGTIKTVQSSTLLKRKITKSFKWDHNIVSSVQFVYTDRTKVEVFEANERVLYTHTHIHVSV